MLRPLSSNFKKHDCFDRGANWIETERLTKIIAIAIHVQDTWHFSKNFKYSDLCSRIFPKPKLVLPPHDSDVHTVKD